MYLKQERERAFQWGEQHPEKNTEDRYKKASNLGWGIDSIRTYSHWWNELSELASVGEMNVQSNQ